MKIIEELKKIIVDEKNKSSNNQYIRTSLKEYLQTYILNYIYSNEEYGNNLIFTGGTCLRQCFNLNRLSEDLDFDYKKEFDIHKFKDNLLEYFNNNFKYNKLDISILQKGKQFRLKFPILHELGIADTSESDLLYIKLDISPLITTKYKLLKTIKTQYGFTYVISHYDLESLMASKIVTIFLRTRFVENNREVIKGRDYFDLLWYLDQKIFPNLERINDLLDEKLSLIDIIRKLDIKVKLAVDRYKEDFKRDLIPFIDNTQAINSYVDSYLDSYELKKKYLI